MLVLSNITLQASKKAFINSTQKMLKISIDEQLVTSDGHGKVKSAILIEWEKPIGLPLHYGKQYTFQIIQKHSFGYNPEELNRVVSGKFTLQKDQNFGTWDVWTDRRQKFGYLSAKVQKRKQFNATELEQSSPQILNVKVAHLSNLRHKRAFAQLILEGGAEPYRTEIAKVRSGQLLFSSHLQIQTNSDVRQARVQIHSYDPKGQDPEFVAKGRLMLNPQQCQKRVVLKSNKGTEVGQIFIDHKITPKDQYFSSKQLSSIVHKGSYMHKSIDLQRRMDATLGTHTVARGLAKTYGQQQLIISRTKPIPHKRPSIVNQNNNIFTPTEQRFKQYIDRENTNCSYLKDKDHPLFDFIENHSKNYYRGASIGRGMKSDFTAERKCNPGVGNYTSPSIWDRY